MFLQCSLFCFLHLILVCFANDPNCGKTVGNTYSDDKIFGGKTVSKGEHPWQISLQQVDYRGRYSHICGGSILNKYWVITAAHCLESNAPLRVVAGTLRISKRESGMTIHSVDKTIIHPDWDFNTLKNDIALIKLKKPIDLENSNGYVNSVCLPERNHFPRGYAKASGWGFTEHGIDSDYLLAVDLPIVTKSYCQRKYGESIDNSVICAGSIQGQDSCSGDSGGPLTQQVNNRGTLIGIVSYGPQDCGSDGWPGVYTNVAYYLDWINKYINPILAY